MDDKKPLDLIITETRQKILIILSESGLPITILGLMISDINHNIRIQEEMTIANLKTQYYDNKNKEKDET